MDAQGLAHLLVESSPTERLQIVRENPSVSLVHLARSLQDLCFEVWTGDPQQVAAIAETNELIAHLSGDQKVRAYADWTNAIECLVGGELTKCIEWLDRSEAGFLAIDELHLAAKTQPSKVYALALLGRYDEAVAAGIAAREVFVKYNDQYSAGKIEHNIGNLYWRRDLYSEAEPYLSSAHERFSAIDDQRQLAMVENCQAFVLTLQNRFREAEVIYQTALARARSHDLNVTQAEIEIGLSNLYLFEGRFDQALKFLELARRRYEQLEMPNQSALCELEIGDIYLELDLLPEAIGLYETAAERFAALGMQAELARATLSHARARLRQEQPAEAALLLDRAETLFRLESNKIAVGSVQLARAQMLFKKGELEEADDQANAALTAFRNGENPRLEIFTRWLRAEILAASGNIGDASKQLSDLLGSHSGLSLEIRYLCHLSLGRLTGSENHLKEAIQLVETSRAALASEELRTTYFASRVGAYDELVRLKLGRGQFERAFVWHEKARSRVLVDRLQSSMFPSEEDEKLRQLREEMNWIYNRMKRSDLSSPEERESAAEFRHSAAKLEKAYSTRARRLRFTGKGVDGMFEFDLEKFRSCLGDAIFVEFAVIDGRYTGFVVTRNELCAFPGYVDESEVNEELKRFIFQIKSGRLFDRLAESNRPAALERLQAHGQRLHDLLLKPLGSSIGRGRLIVAPAGLLHYLPFHALSDRKHYLAERSIISYAPSAAVLARCLKLAPANLEHALIAGVEDITTPMVRAEVEAVAGFFKDGQLLIDDDLTIEALKQHSGGRGIIHLACHGRFRPDNPGFSSLSFKAEELTVNDIYNLPLAKSIIVISACESGLNDVVRGEELVGLTSAFFAAGASTLVLSLWRVNDASTVEMMTGFYEELVTGAGVAEALAAVQRRLIKRGSHPYFWSPFIVAGRG